MSNRNMTPQEEFDSDVERVRSAVHGLMEWEKRTDKHGAQALTQYAALSLLNLDRITRFVREKLK